MNKLPPLNSKNALSLLAAGVMLAGLTACSSSSSDDNSGGGSTAQSVPVTGTAAKGILLGAKVEACVATDCTGDNDPIATATTSTTNGSYTLNIPANNAGTLVIRVSQQDGAKMICDVPAGCGGVAFGEKADMEAGLSLRSVTTVDASATTVEAHVSPLTELVTAAAIESRGVLGTTLNADSVSKGSAAVRTLLGLDEGTDLTKIKPVDITKAEAANADTAALQLSLLAAAFADTASGQSIQQKIKSFTQAIATGSVNASELEGLTDSAKDALAANRALPSDLGAALDEATAGCSESGCTVEIPAAEVDPSEQQQLSTNVIAVKALVADVRTLGWEIYPALRDATDKTNTEKFVADNLIAQAENAGAIFDAGLSEVSGAVSEIATLVSLAIESRNKLGDLTLADLNLRTIAKADYMDMNSWQVPTQQQIDDWCSGDIENCYLYITQEQLETDATAYAEQFSNTTITQSGTAWTVSNAAYNGTPVTLTVTFPNLSTSTSTSTTLSKLDVTITGNATSQDEKTKLTLTEGALSITPSTPLPLQVQDGIWEYTGTGFVIADASLKASATLENTDDENVKRTFTGNIELVAGMSAKQQEKNPGNIAAFLPKKIALNGAFTASNVTGGKLEAKLTSTMDNYDSYSAYVDDTVVDVPATFALSDDLNTLTVSLGSPGNQKSFKVKHYVGYADNGFDFRADESGYSYLHIEDCVGDFNGMEWFCNTGYYDVYSSEKKANVIEALTSSYILDYRLDDFRLNGTPYGTVVFPYDWEDALLGLSAEKSSVSLKAMINSPNRGYEDTADNHVLATITAELTGKLSADLPAADVKLQLQRTGFQAGKADLTLGWTENGSSRKFLQLSAQSSGTTDAEVEENLRVTLSDAAGTTVRLLVADDSTGTNVNVGYISKDGTRYATITNESNGYLVTYHFDENGNPASKESEEFESLY